MPGHPRLPWPALPRVLAALLLGVGASVALAAPSSTGEDAVDRWLVDQGLTGAVQPPASAAAPAPQDAPQAPPAAASAPIAAAPVSSLRERVSEMLVSALGLLGAPYRRGGDSAATGFDCSGFTRYVFESGLGLLLPRRADEQATATTLVPVAKADLQPGDLVFFNTLRRTFSHVGIYLGENRFIHAPSTGKDVRIEDLGLAYWAKRFTGARRVEGQAAGG